MDACFSPAELVGIKLAQGKIVPNEEIRAAFPGMHTIVESDVRLDDPMSLKSLQFLFRGAEPLEMVAKKNISKVSSCWGANLVYHAQNYSYGIDSFFTKFGLEYIDANTYRVRHSDKTSFILSKLLKLSCRANIFHSKISYLELVERLGQAPNFDYGAFDITKSSYEYKELLLGYMTLRYVIIKLKDSDLNAVRMPRKTLSFIIPYVLNKCIHNLEFKSCYTSIEARTMLLESQYGNVAICYSSKKPQISENSVFYKTKLFPRTRCQHVDIGENFDVDSQLPTERVREWMELLNKEPVTSGTIDFDSKSSLTVHTFEVFYRITQNIIGKKMQTGCLKPLVCNDSRKLHFYLKGKNIQAWFWLPF